MEIKKQIKNAPFGAFLLWCVIVHIDIWVYMIHNIFMIEKWTFDNDDLFDLVVSGKKRATCSLYYGDNKMSKPGDINIIYNSKNEQIKIEITDVQKRRFCDIDETWAIKEGEGDLSLSYWRNVHEKFFKNIKPDFQNTDTLELNEFRIL